MAANLYGVVIDLAGLVSEMEEVKKRGIKIADDSVMISENAHLVMPYHKAIDAAKENKMGDKKIGTTARGIGPAYTDKHSRSGIRVRDIFDDEVLELKIKTNLEEKNFLLKTFYKTEEINPQDVIDEIKSEINKLKSKK